jgi:hypothetical protein
MKIFIHPHTDVDFKVCWICPRTELMVLEGLQEIPEVELVDSELSADFVIWHHVPQYAGKKDYQLVNKIDQKKLVVIDSIDENNEYFVQDFNPNNYFLYFKRSIVKTDHNGTRTPIPLIERQFPWDYGILNGFLPPLYFMEKYKNIDVGVYLRPSCAYRNLVLEQMMDWSHYNKDKYNCRVGPVSNASRSIDKEVFFDPTYFSYLRNTKIVVSSGPFGWIGDSRGAEAIANYCIYMSNELWDYMPNPPIPGRHYMKFNPLSREDLYTKLQILLDAPDETLTYLVNLTYDFCIKYHSSKARMQYVVDKIKEYR